jgi:hypothetical protein
MFSTRIKTAILLVIMASPISSRAAILEVNGPDSVYSSIGAAVNASADFDTVLVYPGTYYENVMLLRPITLASLNMTTGNPAYIDSTIIDAQGSASCIRVAIPSKKVIWGFTIRNGGGDEYGYGGGIYADETEMDLVNCKLIQNISTDGGGGIYAYQSDIFLANSSIDSNQTGQSGGGIYMNHGNLTMKGCKIIHNYGGRGGGLFIHDAGISFDTVESSSIYENFGYYGCDIYLYRTAQEPIEIVIDTFSLPEADGYTFSRDEGVTVIVRHGKHQPVDGHIYVSPNGSNDNNGASLSEPLQSLWLAMLKIRTDSLHPGTIHLFPGTFSPTHTSEHFPMSMRDYITLKGARKEETIIDGDSLSNVFYLSGKNNILIRDLTMQRGIGSRHPNEGMVPGLMEIMRCHFLKFSNVAFRRNYSCYAPVAHIYVCDSLVFDSAEVYDNHGSSALRISYTEYSNQKSRTVQFRNSSFHHNLFQNGYFYGSGGSICLSGSQSDTSESTVEFMNCEFHHNQSAPIYTGYPSNPAIYIGYGSTGNLLITNCTFSDNLGTNHSWFSTLVLGYTVKAKIYNSVFFNNEPKDINVSNSNPDDPDYEYDLEIHHSLLELGQQSLWITDTASRIFYSPTNKEGDPLFRGEGEFPYQLLPQSPCRDAGTLSLPDWIILPEVDLACNPRVFNDLVDIGAYEYNEFVGLDEDADLTEDYIRIRAFPNPFSTNVSIVVTIRCCSKGVAGIYSPGGILLNSEPVTSGENTVQWNGCTKSGNPVSPGIYLVIVQLDTGISSSKKIVIIR